MEPVESDIRGLINWCVGVVWVGIYKHVWSQLGLLCRYFFVRFHLQSIYDVYGTLGFIHKWCPLVILVVFVLGWAGVPGKYFFSKLSQVGY